MNLVIDRKVKPASKDINSVDFSFPEKIVLDNGTPVFAYHDKESEVLKIEFQFPAGVAFSEKKLAASFTNSLIASGTSRLNEKEISEKIDFYGAYFEKHIGTDEASFIIYTLKKYATDVSA